MSLRIDRARRAALAFVLFALVACASEPGAPPRHLLLVCVDTLRADHLGLYGYPRATSPHIDRLGAEGLVFEHAVVQWPVTTPSMASMLSGLYPHVTGVVIHAAVNPLPRRMTLLPELLHEQGVPMRVAINEAIELAKKFSTEASGAFVNGILDRIRKDRGLK